MPKTDFRSNAKPSTFAYPPPLEEKKKEESEKVVVSSDIYSSFMLSKRFRRRAFECAFIVEHALV